MIGVKEVRQRKLKHLIEASESQVNLAKKAGLSIGHVSQMNTGTRPMGDKVARRIEQRLGLAAGWLDDPSDLELSTAGQSAKGRPIPIISTVQAGSFWPVEDPYPVGHGDDEIPAFLLPFPVGPRAFGLRVKGDSMREDYYPGDIVVIDPDAQPRAGEPVVAKREQDGEATFKIYRPRGFDDDGHPIIELEPLNEHFPKMVISSEHPGRIIGPMVARIHGRRGHSIAR